MAEQIFLEQQGLQVTNARFVVNGQTYAMSNVTSVKQGTTPASKTGPIILILIGLTMLPIGTTALILGLGAICLGIFWITQLKPTFSVVLSTSSGEAQALSSKDEAYISSVINALNQAIIHRG